MPGARLMPTPTVAVRPQNAAARAATRGVATALRIPVVITIDTEPDDAWSNHLCQSTANVRSLLRFQKMLDRFKAKATLLVTTRVVENAESRDLLKRLVDESGAEIGAHLHPWETPPFMPGQRDVRYPAFPHELPPPLFAEKLARLTEQIERHFGRPTSYRAGRWGFSAAQIPILEKLGYEVDTSVMPLVNWRGTSGIPRKQGGVGGADYRFAPQQPYRLSYEDVCRVGDARLMEYPVSVGFTRPTPRLVREYYGAFPRLVQRALRKLEILRPVWATPPWETHERSLALTRMLLDLPAPAVNLAFHSSEFAVSALPECDSPEKIDRMFATTELMLGMLASYNACEFLTLTTAARRLCSGMAQHGQAGDGRSRPRIAARSTEG